MSGLYVCIEGPDGVGKSTLSKSVVQRFEEMNVPAAYRWFPSDNEVGRVIRSALFGEIKIHSKAFLYLFCADGLQAETDIRQNLSNGVHVICDRHPTLSGRVFQVDNHRAELVDQVYDGAAEEGIMQPDLLFVVDVPPEVSLERMGSREKYRDAVFESDKLDRVTELRDRYIRLARRYKAILLDGTLSIEQLSDLVIARIGVSLADRVIGGRR